MSRDRAGAIAACVAVLGAAVAMTSAASGSHTLAGRQVRTPAGPTRAGLLALPAGARAPISAAIGRADPAYGIVDGAAGNPVQRLRARFAPAGVTVTAPGGGQISFGIRAGGASVPLRIIGNRADYLAGDVREWWTNGPLGLEQGFVVRSAAASADRVLTIAVPISGTLHPSLAGDDVLLSGDGTALRYGDLSASDAAGRSLPATLSLRPGAIDIYVKVAGARFPVRIDPLVQQAELSNTGGAAGEGFGSSVAISGSTIAVGAPDGGGAVYVFTDPAAGWASTTAPSAVLSDGSTGEVGYSVAIDASADTIVAGAPGDDDAFVFTKPSGGWTSTATASATLSNSMPGSALGASVAIDAAGDTIAVGAPLATANSDSEQGAVYAFIRPTNGWVAAQTPTNEMIEGASGATQDGLGWSAAISASGTTIVAGAPGLCSGTCGGEARVGAADVFTTTTGWIHSGPITPVAVLTSSDGASDPGDKFGESVALAGSVIAVGAPVHQVGSNQGQGAVYMFGEPSDGAWANATQSAELTQNSGSAGDALGTSVGLSPTGGTLIAGAPAITGAGAEPAGAAYLFDEPAGGWPAGPSMLTLHESGALTPSDGVAKDDFGYGGAFTGSTAVLGAPGHQPSGGENAQGAAYVFSFPSPTITITAPASNASYTEGARVDASYSCSVSGSTITTCAGTVASGSPINTATAGTHTFNVTATTADGVQSTDTISYTVAAPAVNPSLVKPSLARVSESSHRWTQKAGTTFSYVLSRAATVTFTFADKAKGRKVGRRCVAETKHNRRDRSCTITVGTVSMRAAAGAHKLKFNGRMSRGKRLSPGTYTVTVAAADAAGRSKTVTLSFTVLKPARRKKK